MAQRAAKSSSSTHGTVNEVVALEHDDLIDD